MKRLAVLLLVLVMAGCGSAVAPAGDADAGGQTIDADVPGAPDAAPGTPDAAPDAAPGTPDAAPGTPDAGAPPPAPFQPRLLVPGAGRLIRSDLIVDVELGHALDPGVTLTGPGGLSLTSATAVQP